MLYFATIMAMQRYINVTDDLDCMATDVIAGTLMEHPDTDDHGDLIAWIHEYAEKENLPDNTFVIVNTTDLLMEGKLNKL